MEVIGSGFKKWCSTPIYEYDLLVHWLIFIALSIKSRNKFNACIVIFVFLGILAPFNTMSKNQDSFLEIAEKMVVYQLRSKWLSISRLYNEMASEQGGTMSMAFVLLTIHTEKGTPVTKIAPRMGMEPNSLSRILKSMEKKGLIYKRKSKSDKRKVYICLTDHGNSMREVALEAVFSLENAIQDTISEDDLKGFFNVMQRIPNAMNAMKEKLGFEEHELD